MRKAGILLIIALAQPASAADPITKTEIRAASPREAKRQVMAQLSDLLLSSPFKGRKGRPPKRPLSDLWFYTKPHGTATKGVCLSNTVIVRFRPVVEDQHDANTPVEASGIETSNYYRLMAPVDPDSLHELDAAGQLRADEECGRIDPREADMISAPDEDTLVNGLWLLRRAQATAGTASASPVDCNGFKQPCTGVLAAIDPAKVDSVGTCPSSRDASCYDVENGTTSAELRTDAHGQLASIKLSEEIIIADERAD